MTHGARLTPTPNSYRNPYPYPYPYRYRYPYPYPTPYHQATHGSSPRSWCPWACRRCYVT